MSGTKTANKPIDTIQSQPMRLLEWRAMASTPTVAKAKKASCCAASFDNAAARGRSVAGKVWNRQVSTAMSSGTFPITSTEVTAQHNQASQVVQRPLIGHGP